MILYWCKDCKQYFVHALFKDYCHYCTSKNVISITLRKEAYPFFYCKDRGEWGIPCEKVEEPNGGGK